jgi:hypothetical protein
MFNLLCGIWLHFLNAFTALCKILKFGKERNLKFKEII